MNNKLRFLAGSFLLVFVISFLFFHSYPLYSAPPTAVKDTLSNSQLSFFARSIGASINDTLIRINQTSGTAPSITTNNLFVGDTIAIAGLGSTTLNIYTVKDVAGTAGFQISSSLAAGNTAVSAAIIATRSAIHTIVFSPQTNFTGGYWQFLIKASSRAGETANDGIPDQQGFDLGATTPTSGATGLGTRLTSADVNCSGLAGATTFSVGTTVGIVTGGTTNYYHVITCSLGAGITNATGVGVSYAVTIGRDLGSGSQLINPSAKDSGHTEGNADVYTFYIRHLDNTQTLQDADTVQGKIAVVESVRVTATVDPTLTFTIGTTNATQVGGTACGTTMASTANSTSGDSVSFGSLALGSANDLAQVLSAVTNASGGYVVTAYETGSMKNIADSATIADTNCGGTGCTSSSEQTWTTYSASGWGYTLQNLNVGTSIFSYPKYRPFGNGQANAQTIMKNTTTPTTTEQAYICYRIAVATSQEAGNYENHLVYTATSTF